MIDLQMSRSQLASKLQRLQREFQLLKPEEVHVFRGDGWEGWVVVDNTLAAKNGPLGRCGKGGTRISAAVTSEEIEMLARRMTLKNAAAGLPLGGAKSGLKADPRAPNFEAIYRDFVRRIKPLFVENGGRFGGLGFDIGAHPIHAVWACDEAKSTRCFTGKAVEMGGTDYDRNGIAGWGVVCAAIRALAEENRFSATAAVQGLGAMGSAVIRYFTEAGGSVRFVSDPLIGGTSYFPSGLPSDIREAIVRHDLATARSLIVAGGYDHLPLEDVLYQEVDITFPCAMQDVVDDVNVDRVVSPFVVEGANNPCARSAQNRLFQRNITLIPDFIANPGGIIAAFVEMTSRITPEENARTRQIVTDAMRLTQRKIQENVGTMLPLARKLGVPPYEVGEYMALTKILG